MTEQELDDELKTIDSIHIKDISIMSDEEYERLQKELDEMWLNENEN